jgi:hypothetical protein
MVSNQPGLVALRTAGSRSNPPPAWPHRRLRPIRSPATASEQRHPESDADLTLARRRGGAQASVWRTALLNRRITRLQIQLRDEQRLGNEAERQLVERANGGERPAAATSMSDGNLSDDERAAAKRRSPASPTGILALPPAQRSSIRAPARYRRQSPTRRRTTLNRHAPFERDSRPRRSHVLNWRTGRRSSARRPGPAPHRRSPPSAR